MGKAKKKARVNKVSAKVEFDLFCDWFDHPPVYRVYIEHIDTYKELMTERTYTWTGVDYVREIVPLSVTPGTYSILVEPYSEGTFKIRNTSGSENVHWQTTTRFEVTG